MYHIWESIVVMKQIYFEILMDLLVFITLNTSKWFCSAAYLPACLFVCMAVCVCIWINVYLTSARTILQI